MSAAQLKYREEPMAEIIDGRAVAKKVEAETKAQVDAMVAAGKPRPGLAVILVGEDPASEVYVGRKIKKCAEVGIRSFEHRMPAETRRRSGGCATRSPRSATGFRSIRASRRVSQQGA